MYFFAARRLKVSSVKPVSIIISLLGWLAVEEIGHKATDVARILGIKRVSVHQAAKKGKRVLLCR